MGDFLSKPKIILASLSIICMFLLAFFYLKKESVIIAKTELGTYKNPEIAFKETRKKLELLSQNINIGIKSVQYVKEYENTKDKIFIKNKNNK